MSGAGLIDVGEAHPGLRGGKESAFWEGVGKEPSLVFASLLLLHTSSFRQHFFLELIPNMSENSVIEWTFKISRRQEGNNLMLGLTGE